MLEKNHYPGRGIIIGRTSEGDKAVVAYFIMGRSENSRNRIFETTEDGIRTCAYDESKMVDPSLIIYHPVRKIGRAFIVTNGDQTDTIREFLEKGLTFEQALRTREFEPDAPNWTPRISGLLSPDGSYKLSILKSADSAGTACTRQTFEYPGLSGVGHYIHTYKCDGNPIPSFEGEPETVTIAHNIDDFTDELWHDLDEDNKVSLYVAFHDLSIGAAEIRIVNKNQ
ncbi:MAG: IMP cyclohydrolase [Oscillospiraceae bacterium]